LGHQIILNSLPYANKETLIVYHHPSYGAEFEEDEELRNKKRYAAQGKSFPKIHCLKSSGKLELLNLAKASNS